VNVLVVAAHPDDEVLGCGATAAQLCAGGHNVEIAILGEGVTARYADRKKADPAELRALKDASRRAARALGVRNVVHHDLPDNRFDSLALLDIVKIVESEIARVRPEIVFTHHGGDLNIDHALTFRAVLTATRPTPGSFVRALYAFEVASSSEWSFGRLGTAFRPNVFVDVGATVEAKVEALGCYDTETRVFPHPRSPEAVRASASRWGTVSGRTAAEPFELIRETRTGF
jgi:LmbE family N-acetylglucosaminyl deacetylase